MLPRVGCALGQGSEVQGIPSACGSKGQALCRTPAQDPFLPCRASEKLSPFGTGWHQGKGLLLAAGHGGCAWPSRLRSARQRRGTDSWCCSWGAVLMAPSCARNGTGGAWRCGSSVLVRVHAAGSTGVEQRGLQPTRRLHPAGLQSALLAWLQQAASPQERRELERLWVLFLSALELFLQDLCCAHRLCCTFSPGVGGVTPLCTGLGGWRGGGPELPPAPPCLEEEMEQVRAMLVEMESTANIPLWTVESTHVVGPGEGTAPTSHRPGPGTGSCCRVL